MPVKHNRAQSVYSGSYGGLQTERTTTAVLRLLLQTSLARRKDTGMRFVANAFFSRQIGVVCKQKNLEFFSKSEAQEQSVVYLSHNFGRQFAYFFFDTTFVYRANLFQQHDRIFG